MHTYLVLGKECLTLKWLQVQLKEAAQILKDTRRPSFPHLDLHNAGDGA